MESSMRKGPSKPGCPAADLYTCSHLHGRHSVHSGALHCTAQATASRCWGMGGLNTRPHLHSMRSSATRLAWRSLMHGGS